MRQMVYNRKTGTYEPVIPDRWGGQMKDIKVLVVEDEESIGALGGLLSE